MLVLCAIGLRSGRQMIRRLLTVVGTGPDLRLLHVIDVRPLHEVERVAGPLRHGPLGGPARDRAISAAEEAAGSEALAGALQEAQQAGGRAVMRLERGVPEHVVVAVAREIGASLVVVCAREIPDGIALPGPASIGHTARFVIDHAPCDVLLLRFCAES
ncbi:MAG: universal stress protein [Chloroflexi bacterium]|nr:universal stress protein [Chloroflexota bacterium]MDA8189721.1 universal stress protein [Dehalococcoidales bacterium]